MEFVVWKGWMMVRRSRSSSRNIFKNMNMSIDSLCQLLIQRKKMLVAGLKPFQAVNWEALSFQKGL